MVFYTILASLFVISLANADTPKFTLTVSKYTGLKRSEMARFSNQHYDFEFCLCPASFNENDLPGSINKCLCNTQKGKTFTESIPHASYPLSCKFTHSAQKCLVSTISNQSLEMLTRLFVRVSIGSTAVTDPSFQNIPFSPSQRSIMLKTDSKPKIIRITYSTSLDSNNLDAENEQLIEQFAKKVMKDNKIDETNMITDSDDLSVGKSQQSLNDVINFNNFNSVKRFIFEKSKIDKIDPAGYDVTALKHALLKYHNIYRARHNAPPVTADPVLEHRGKIWADELSHHKGCLIHEQPRVYGENLFFFGARHLPNPDVLAKSIMQSFYLEGYGYNYKSWKPMSYFKTGHFTQMIWQASRRIGVGVSIVKGGSLHTPCFTSSPNMYFIYVVIKYDPAGNYETREEYFKNVVPPVV